MTDGLGLKLRKLLENGFTLEDSCETLELDIEGARAYLMAQSKKEVSADDFLKENKLVALKALMTIGLDSSIENVSARVAALRIIAEGEGEMPELPVDKYSELFAKMKERVGSYKVVENKTKTVSLENKVPENKKEEYEKVA